MSCRVSRTLPSSLHQAHTSRSQKMIANSHPSEQLAQKTVFPEPSTYHNPVSGFAKEGSWASEGVEARWGAKKRKAPQVQPHLITSWPALVVQHLQPMNLNFIGRTSPGVQWVRICPPMQGTRVWSLVMEDPKCWGQLKPVSHNCWAHIVESPSRNYWSPRAATDEACAPRACALQQEKPPRWEACAPQRRVAPVRHS